MRQLKTKAFTLLECLVALLVISGSVLVLSNLTVVLKQEIIRGQKDKEKDWQIFCGQMREELADSHFDKVENNFLYVTKDNQALRFGKSAQADDFRKSASNGRGYQPMLYGLTTSTCQVSYGIVKITVKFDEGGERTFIYKFLDAAK